jgi:hypothetical protein
MSFWVVSRFGWYFHLSRHTRQFRKPVISPAEIERRRRHVRVAIADNRIEGNPPSPEVEEICTAYIRGEIEAHDLVKVYQRLVSGSSYSSDQ